MPASRDRDDHPGLVWPTPPLVVDGVAQGRNEIHIRICGELDLLTHPMLEAALARVDHDQASIVRLQLAELMFSDVRGAGLLLGFVKRMREAGHVATIDHPRPNLRKLLHLIAPDFSV